MTVRGEEIEHEVWVQRVGGRLTSDERSMCDAIAAIINREIRAVVQAALEYAGRNWTEADIDSIVGKP